MCSSNCLEIVDDVARIWFFLINELIGGTAIVWSFRTACMDFISVQYPKYIQSNRHIYTISFMHEHDWNCLAIYFFIFLWLPHGINGRHEFFFHSLLMLVARLETRSEKSRLSESESQINVGKNAICRYGSNAACRSQKMRKKAQTKRKSEKCINSVVHIHSAFVGGVAILLRIYHLKRLHSFT